MGNLFCSHLIDPDAAAITTVQTDSKILQVRGEKGTVEITADNRAEITITDTKGAIVARRSIEAGATSISLSPGIYIVNDTKVAVR